MPKAQKNTVNNMAAWLWKAPAKFAALMVGGLFAIVLILALITLPFSKPMPEFVAYIITAIIFVFMMFAIYKLVRFAPSEQLDRRSFVAIDVGTTTLTFLFYMVLPLIVIVSLGLPGFDGLMLYSGLYFGMLIHTNPAVFFISMALISLLISYVAGVALISYVATYGRARKMGVSKLRAILSFPFGLRLLWMPGFLLGEEKKVKPALEIKTKWYARIADWIVSKPTNALITWFLMLAATVIVPGIIGLDVFTLSTEILLIVLFALPLAMLGCKKFIKTIPGWFSAMAVAVNVVLVAMFVTIYTLGVIQLSSQTMPAEYIDDIEVVQSIEMEDLEIIDINE